MEFTIATPAILFPAISLLLLAYTNRFMGIASVIRQLHAEYHAEPNELIIKQISNLRKRVRLIRNMQTVGISSIFLCVFCMILLMFGIVEPARIVFGISLFLLLYSLGLSTYEIYVSTEALAIQLSDLQIEEERIRVFPLLVRPKKTAKSKPNKNENREHDGL